MYENRLSSLLAVLPGCHKQNTMYAAVSKTNLEGEWVGVIWVEPVAMSKFVALPYSHIKAVSVLTAGRADMSRVENTAFTLL